MILDKIRGKKKKEGPKVPRSAFLKTIPIRNPMVRWEKNDDGIITIFITLKDPEKGKEENKKNDKKKKKSGILSTIVSTPKEKQFQLDIIGSIVWDLCDGKRTIGDIIKHLYKEYKLLPAEAELSLNSFFNNLSKRKLMGFGIPEEVRDQLKKAMEKETEKEKRE